MRGLFSGLVYLMVCSLYGSPFVGTPWRLHRPISLDTGVQEDITIKIMIAPYKKQMIQIVSKQIAVAHCELSTKKDGQRLSALLAKMLYDEGNAFCNKYHYPNVDFAFMGRGSVRRSYLYKNITVGDIYEVMPFENELVILAVSGRVVQQLIARYVKDAGRRMHPIYGLDLYWKEGRFVKALLRGKEIKPNKDYYIALPNYLANGGDGMAFFKEGTPVNTRLKLRDVFLKHFSLLSEITEQNAPVLPIYKE